MTDATVRLQSGNMYDINVSYDITEYKACKANLRVADTHNLA